MYGTGKRHGHMTLACPVREGQGHLRGVSVLDQRALQVNERWFCCLLFTQLIFSLFLQTV